MSGRCRYFPPLTLGLFMLVLTLAFNYVLLGATMFTNPLFLAPAPRDSRALENSHEMMAHESSTETMALESSSSETMAHDSSTEAMALESSSSETIAHRPPSPVMVAILCDARSLSTLGHVVLDTWAKDMPYDFRFFTGEVESTAGEESISIPEALEPYTIRLAAPDGYPPRKKELTLFKYLHDNFGQYSWYMKVDIDSYLNVRELEKIVEQLLAWGSIEGYIGNPGFGREFERVSLGLNGPYCIGLGYLMGRQTLVKLRPELDWCLANPHSEHSDTEIGNCIYKTSNATCQKMGKYVNYYFSYGADGFVTNVKVDNNSTNQQIHSPQAVYFGSALKAVLVHALKNPSDMRTLHMQLTRNLRPTFSAPWVVHNNITYQLTNGATEHGGSAEPQVVRFLPKACVNNPVVQITSKAGFFLPECEPLQHSFITPNLSAIPTYALNLPHRKDRYELLLKRFSKSTSLNVTRFEAVNGIELYSQEDLPNVQGEGNRQLKPGEQGYRMSMRALLKKALHDDTRFMLVLDDDAVPHNDFDKHLMNMLNDNRCGGHLLSDHEGGVLQLGGTIYRDDVWGYIEEDLSRAQTQYGQAPLCFNSHLKVLGSFAILYHRNTFQEIIDWIDHGPVQPFDWVFDWLAQKGYITRVSHPFLVIPDVSMVSQVNPSRKTGNLTMAERAKLHRWELDNFNKAFDMNVTDSAIAADMV